MRRRDIIVAAAAAASGLAVAQTRKNRIKQSAMRVNFAPGTSLEEMCRIASGLGCKGMDLVATQDWPTLKKYGLIPSMGPIAPMTINDGMLRKELHDQLEAGMRANIDQCAAVGCPDVIAVGGQRHGISYEAGADICVGFLNRLKAHAEDKGVTVCLEIMNSKYDKPDIGRTDQICDHLAWGFDVCKRVNSPRVKMLFDIYHAQIMDGNICENIRQNIQWIGHFHTGGVPGRHELDDTQELNYGLVAKTIADAGFTGFVAHEYRPGPGRDPIQSLTQAVQLFNV